MENSTLTIKRKRPAAVPFSKLEIGEIFEFANCDDILIKTEAVTLLNHKDVTKNAVSLKDGKLCMVGNLWKVFRVNATLMEE